MKKINILYVIWSLGLGGAEKVVINLAKGLDKDKFIPLVCCLNEKGPFADKLEENGIKVIPLYKKGKIDIFIIVKLISIIRQYHIGIIHTHLWGANFWGRIAGILTRVPVVVTEHNIDEWKTSFHFLCDKILSFFTPKIITVSNKVKDFYIKHAHLSVTKLNVIYNGIDVSAFENNHVGSKKNGEFKVGIIGRIVPQKGHRYFLEAIKLVREKYPMVKGVVVGNGPLEKEIIKYAEDIEIDENIDFLGFKENIKDILSSLDMIAMPSLREGLPIIALEAMASGIPVVATDVGGVSEVVKDGETGFVVPTRDSKTFASAIEALIDNDAMRKKMEAKGKERVKNCFNVEQMLKSHQDIYGQLAWKRS